MIVILDHSLLRLSIGLVGNETEYSGATHNFISSQWYSDQGVEIVTNS